MLQRLLEDRHDVLVVEGVEHDAALAPRPDKSQAAQQPELMRYGRLAQAKHGRQITDAQLAMGKRIQDPHAGGIAQRAEGIGKALHRIASDQRSPQRPHARKIDLHQVTYVVLFEHMSSCSYINAAAGPSQTR